MRVRLIQNEASEIRKNASAEAVLIAAKAEADAKYKVRIVHRGGKGGCRKLHITRSVTCNSYRECPKGRKKRRRQCRCHANATG